jgi:hypothetical protein
VTLLAGAVPAAADRGTDRGAGRGAGRGADSATAAPRPVAIRCGQAIATDAILAADLVCASNPLVVSADNITLDLRGHTLSGTGVGISVSRSGVTIRNGTIQGVSLSAAGAAGLTLRRLTLTAGASVNPGRFEVIRTIAIFDSAFGQGTSLNLTGCKSCPIQHTAFHGSSITATDSTSGVVISKNSTFVDSPVHLTEVGAISIFDSRFTNSPVIFRASSGLTFSGNTFSDATVGVGIDTGFFGGAFVFVGNSFTRNDIGIAFTDPFNGPVTVSNNTFTGNRAAGMLLVTHGNGVAVTITSNEFRRNGFAPGGRVDFSGQPLDDGLHIDPMTGTAVTITANHTFHNADRGIDAPPTVTDGGGNESTGDPNGCLGVTCS